MAEIPNVIGGETITSDWGNDLRDRAIMRYASSAARTASMPTPTAGDLSFLEDVGLVYVYAAGAWRTLGGPESLDNSTAVTTISPTASFTDLATVAITIPGHWDGWSIMAIATFANLSGAGTVAHYQMSIDGNLGNEVVIAAPSSTAAAAVGHRHTAATTGSRTIALRGRHTGVAVTVQDIFLYARATRTA